MKSKMVPLGCLVMLAVLVLGACGAAETSPTAVPTAGMPNPAAVYCEEHGGTVEIRTAADGSQSGVCKFPDGSECGDWAYYRGECAPGQFMPDAKVANPASVYCQDNGGTVEIRTAADGSQSGACRFADGSECDEWAYFRGECRPATQATPYP